MKKLSKLLTLFLLLFVGLFTITSCSNKNTPSKTSEIIKNGKNVYFAGPMFNYEEKLFNLRLTNLLESYGYKVFLPQRDGIEAALLEGKTEQELIEMIFPLDVQNVLNADIIFMNCDGRVPDEGAAVELGIAYQAGKRCYGFKTDTRSVEHEMDLNPMIAGCFIKLFYNFDGEALIEEIKDYLNHNAL